MYQQSIEDYKKTSCLEQYNAYFADIVTKVDPNDLLQRVVGSGISADNFNRPNDIEVEPIKVEKRGALVTFRVTIGQFHVRVLMLHIPGKGRMMDKKVLYKCKNVEVLELKSLNGGSYVAKRGLFKDSIEVLRFNEDNTNWRVPGSIEEIHTKITECAFGKLCSALRIGVKMGSPDHPFDIVCCDSYIEFYMQRCCSLNESGSLLDIRETEQRLKYQIYTMHQFGLIHKDVKPNNFLLNSQRQVVLADFGISTFVTTAPGEKTHTYREGTLKFMSPAMVELGFRGSGQVDLFYNDMWGLKRSLELIDAISHSVKEIPQSLGECQHKILSEDKAIYELGCCLKGKADNEGKVVPSDLTVKLFASYFPEVGSQPINQQEFEVEFLLRTFGVCPRLIFYLQQITMPSAHTKCLLAKLIRRTEMFSKMQSTKPYLPQKLASLQRAYREALEDQKDASDPDFLLPAVGWTGLAYAEYILQDNHYEKTLEILEEIQPYLSSKETSRTASLRIRAEVLKQQPDLSLIDTLLKMASREDHKLIDAVMSCFERTDYSLAIRLISFLFPSEDINIGEKQHTAMQVVKYLEAVLQKFPRSNNHEVWGRIWEFFGFCALSIMEPRRIVAAAIRFPTSVPTSIRLKIAQYISRSLFQVSQYRQCLLELDSAIQLSNEIYSECSTKSALLILERCFILAKLKEYSSARAIALKYLRYIETAIGEESRVVCFALRVSCEIEFLQQNFEACLQHLVRAFGIVNKIKINDESSLSIISEMSITLAAVSDRKEEINQIRNAFLLLEQYSNKPASKTLRARLCFFQIYLSLEVISTQLGQQERAVEWNNRARLLQCEARDATEAFQFGKYLTKLCELHKRLNDKDKCISNSLAVADIVFTYRQECNLAVMLRLCLAACTLAELHVHEKVQQELLTITISLLQSEPEELDIHIQYALAEKMFDARLLVEAYTVVKPLFSKLSCSVFLAARCEFFDGSEDQGQRLFLEYLQRDKDLADYEQRKKIAQSHSYLRQIYLKRGEQIKGEYHLKEALKSFSLLKPDNLQREAELQIQLMLVARNSNCRRLYLSCRARLFQIAIKSKSKTYFRWICLNMVVEAAYNSHDYEFAFRCVRIADKLERYHVQPFVCLMMACSCVILRRPKYFYPVAVFMQQRSLQFYKRLLTTLSERRQFIKIYLLEDKPPEECNILKRIINALEKGHLKQNGGASLKHNISELAFTKQLRRQSLYRRGVAVQNSLIRGLIKTMVKVLHAKTEGIN